MVVTSALNNAIPKIVDKGTLCTEQLTIPVLKTPIPFDVRFGTKVEKGESCKERGFCKALTAAQFAQAFPLGTKGKGGC